MLSSARCQVSFSQKFKMTVQYDTVLSNLYVENGRNGSSSILSLIPFNTRVTYQLILFPFTDQSHYSLLTLLHIFRNHTEQNYSHSSLTLNVEASSHS